jgi:hypothetical protein
MRLCLCLWALVSAGLSVLGAEVKLKGTTITGTDITSFGVEFFGGALIHNERHRKQGFITP